ncbi:MAG TPA: helix-turn-helix domain-containing protein [Syntrophomonadaceae bacterium]|nr:helix-turn-helix domain-containing protein [Syntrophomonadaceae bacterium]
MAEQGSFPPWSRIPSLQEMSQEAGVDFNQLIQSFQEGLSPKDLAVRFGVSENTMACLQDHFQHYGISSVMGGD